MTDLAPNTPVLVGVAALQQRFEGVNDGLEPSAMMIEVLRRAAADAGSEALLTQADRIEVPKGMWHYTDPARLVADALGANAATTVLGEIGILQQSLMNRACASINSGEAQIVLVTGAEAKYRSLKAQIAGVEVQETVQAEDVPDVLLEPTAELWSALESSTGLGMPVGYFAIMDSALRYAQGISVGEHRDQMAAMYAEFSQIAAANADAWVREPVAAEFIRNPSAGNKMLAFPYTKLHNSQWNVDQAAGLIFCSVAMATELGIDPQRWVYPLAATESNAMSVVAARKELHRNHGFRLAGQRLLELAGRSTDDIGLMELYSCFPQAVRVQLQELELGQGVPLSVTGAMTFGGGPLNNFVLQSTVKIAQMLRQSEHESGLVSWWKIMKVRQRLPAIRCCFKAHRPGGRLQSAICPAVNGRSPIQNKVIFWKRCRVGSFAGAR